MMRFAAVPMLLLVACTPELKRDKVIAKAERPVQLTVRRHETRVKQPCEETGFNVYKCWLTRAEKRGCVYLDVGTPYDDPGTEDPCLHNGAARLMLAPDPLPVDFEVDAEGYRFAWRNETIWSLGYIWDGKMLVSPASRGGESLYRYQNNLPRAGTGGLPGTKSTTPIDWRALKSFDDALPELYFYADEQTQAQLLARLRKLGGEEAVEKMLLANLDHTASGWEEAFESVAPDAQKRIADSLVEGVLEGGPEEAIEWLDEHPALVPKDFERRLLERAKAGLYDDEFDRTSHWLSRGYRQHRPEVGALACQLLEANELISTWGMSGGAATDATAYAVVGLTHTRCAAVTREFAGSPCTTELRCPHTPAGSEENPSDAADPLELCDERDLKLLDGAVRDSENLFDNFEPAARLAALLAQGPLPKSFTLANARRSYRLLRPDAGADPGLSTDSNALCFGDDEALGEFFCKLRVEQTHFALSRCEVEIDDAKKQVRLTLLEAPDGGLLAPSRP